MENEYLSDEMILKNKCCQVVNIAFCLDLITRYFKTDHASKYLAI